MDDIARGQQQLDRLVDRNAQTGKTTLYETAYYSTGSTMSGGYAWAYLRTSVDGAKTWSQAIQPPAWSGVNEVALCRARNGDLIAAVVLSANAKQITAVRANGDAVQISGDGLKAAQSGLSDKAAPNIRIRRGAVIRVQPDDKGAWTIQQLPEVEAAFVSASPASGAVHALVGGFDFNVSKFNHVLQAWRQPGSSFKPFIYSASLERGVTHDPAFEQWANKVWHFGAGLGAEVSLKDFRKDITIDMFNEAGQLVLSYKVFRCWVSEYQALPDLDANADAVAIQHIKLENEGWERDPAVTEPTEPSFQG